jgi:hypothetical protein
MEDKETTQVKMNESQQRRQIVDDLWEVYEEMERQKGLLWTRLHRLERALGMKE